MANEFKYKLGLKISPNDHRDIKYSITDTSKILPLSYDIQNIHNVYCQGDINSCSANAICNQIMSLQPIDNIVQCSRLFQYWNSRAISDEEQFDNGVTYRNAYKALAKFGWTDEKYWEYITDNVCVKPSDIAYEKADKQLVKRYKSLPNNLYIIKHAICENLPVAAGIMIYSNFKPDDDNIIPMPGGTLQGGHAVLLTSYSDSDKCFILLNSWGTTWGNSGCAKIPYEFILNIEYCPELWVIDCK